MKNGLLFRKFNPVSASVRVNRIAGAFPAACCEG